MPSCAIIRPMSQTYPISLLLTDKPVLVVGGGEVATRKVRGLLDTGARITVVAPVVTPEIEELASQDLCAWQNRTYVTHDLDEVTLVFVCTNDAAINQQVFDEATERRLLVNVADKPELCSFYLPSVLRRGMLSIAVSTEGSSPLTARRIRERLETQFGRELEAYLQLLKSWRHKAITTLSEEQRERFWQRASEGQVYELIDQGELEQAEALLSSLYSELLSE